MKNWKEVLLFIVSSLVWIDIFVFANSGPRFEIIVPLALLLAVLPIAFRKKIGHLFKIVFSRKHHHPRHEVHHS